MRVWGGSTWFAAMAVTFPAIADPITIEDHAGRSITVEQPVEKVVVAPLPIASTFVAVDQGPDRLAGMNPLAQDVIMGSVLGEIFPEIAAINSDVVSRDFVPNVEELLTVNPDVVIQWAMSEDEIIAPMERAGLNVVAFSWGDHDIERDRISLLGAILGQQDRAAEFLAWEDEVVAEIAAGLDTVAVEDRPTMVFIDTWEGNQFNIFGRNAYYFQASGLRNMAFEAGTTEGLVSIDAETMLAWDPDIIFINYYAIEATTDELLAHPVLGSLTAFESGRIYKTPFLDPASQSGPLVYMWFAMLGMPDVFAWDLRSLIAERYQVMYGAVPTDEQIDRLLQMEVNGDRALYGDLFDAK